MSQLNWTKIINTKDQISSIPLAVGVYRYWAKDKIIYVGKSVVIRARLNSHAQNARFDQKERAIVESATHIDYTITDNEFKALLLEAEEIKIHQPVYNRILKDGKSALYIVINPRDTYPKPRLMRATDLPKQQITQAKLRVFGPFPSTQIAESVLRTIRQLIPFCQQKSLGKRSCFYSHLGLCSPCPSHIEQQIDPREKGRLQKLYKSNIRRITRILDGHYESIILSLQKEIKLASTLQNFELALKLRNKVSSFERYIATHSFSDKRILSFHTADSALNSLSLHLGPACRTGRVSPLTRIECYDASHNNFQDNVVAMVVATNGELDRGEYKRFRLKRPNNKSDFDQLEEALIRRFKHTDWPRPDLIVIDGGAPQLRKLQPVLDQLESLPPMIGLAKHPDHLVIPHYDNSTVSVRSLERRRNYSSVSYTRLNLPISDKGLNLLQTLRDEAHRFGNQYRLILNKKKSKL